jgi:hypothetical protein
MPPGRRFQCILPAVLLFAAGFLVPSGDTAAQSGGPYDLGWHNIAGGGATFSTGGVYRLGGAIGQSDAGALSGGGYTIQGGFFVPVASCCVDVPASGVAPRAFALHAAAPNPFRGATTFAFELPNPERVAVAIFAVDGRRVRKLLDEDRGVGRHVVLWDGRDDAERTVAPGVYLVRLAAGTFVASRRLVHLD